MSRAAAFSRKPCAAGKFYPSDPAELGALVDRCLAENPGREPACAPLAVIAPHAGYAYSGPTAALAARALALAAPRTVVILGTAHFWPRGGAALAPHAAFETPLGSVEIDRGLAAELARLPRFEVSQEAHAAEHSVENLLPFLQRLMPGVRIAPVVVGGGDAAACAEMGRALGRALRGTGAAVAVSSDLSHYPPAAAAELADAASLEALGSIEPDLFWRTCDLLEDRIPELDCAWCGRGAAAVGLAAAAELGAGRLEILHRTHSGETGGGGDRVVGYAAAALESGRREPSVLSAEEGRALLSAAREALSRSARRENAVEPGLSPFPRLNLPAFAFVSLHRRGSGELRACLGTLEPDKTLLEAVAWAAARSAFADERFRPVSPAELADLQIEVSVLSPLRRARPEEIRPGLDGVEIVLSGRRALFLPQMWKTFPRVEEFLGVLCEDKAGLPREAWRDPSAQLRAFTVRIFSEG